MTKNRQRPATIALFLDVLKQMDESIKNHAIKTQSDRRRGQETEEDNRKQRSDTQGLHLNNALRED